MKRIILAALVCLVFLSGCKEVFTAQDCKEEFNLTEPQVCPVVEEKALVYEQLINWAENIDDPNEVLFDMVLVNYGLVEAKNVEVKCYIDNNKDVRLSEITENIGNIGSSSAINKQIALKSKSPELSEGFCYVTKCDDCSILNERIAEVQKYRR